jgi:hypothetical protein
MPTKEEILKEFDELLAQNVWIPSEFPDRDMQEQCLYVEFRTRALNLVRRVCGEESDHYKELERIATGELTARNPYHLADCRAVARAAQNDFKKGFLFDLRAVIEAELLGDFIDQAQHLLDTKHKDPAASLAGAVLEDTLRKLCDRHKIPYPPKTAIGTLNAELAKKGVYNNLVQKLVTAYADIRNNADHGFFSKYSDQDVAEMIKWVRRFAADYLK